MHNNDDYIVNSVENGATGYLLKDTNKEEILKAIETVSSGRKYFPPTISEVIINDLLDKNVGNRKTKLGESKNFLADYSKRNPDFKINHSRVEQ